MAKHGSASPSSFKLNSVNSGLRFQPGTHELCLKSFMDIQLMKTCGEPRRRPPVSTQAAAAAAPCGAAPGPHRNYGHRHRQRHQQLVVPVDLDSPGVCV